MSEDKTLKEKLEALVATYGYETSYVENMLWAIEQPGAIVDEHYVMLENKDVALMHKGGFKIMNQTTTWHYYYAFGEYYINAEN